MFDDVFGTDFFGYLAANPQLSQQFNKTMRQASLPTARALPAAFDFARFHIVADIGGGDGTLIAEVLKAFPEVHGILYDTAEGSAQAEDTLRAAGVRDRCDIRTGDFFDSVPDAADAYLIKSVIHDWDDDRCATILGHCRRVIPDDGRLLVVEPVLPDVVDPSMPALMYLSDLNMLVNVGGRERTRADFETLFARSGFSLHAVHPLSAPAPFSLLEAVPSASA